MELRVTAVVQRHQLCAVPSDPAGCIDELHIGLRTRDRPLGPPVIGAAQGQRLPDHGSLGGSRPSGRAIQAQRQRGGPRPQPASRITNG